MRRQLLRRKRALLAKGKIAYLQSADDELLLHTKKITTQISNINTHIKILNDQGNLVTTYKIESDAVKRDFVASTYGRNR
jgi:hypothetical protein